MNQNYIQLKMLSDVMISPGDIILVPFPFTDLTNQKIRPALVLTVIGHDIIIAAISSQLNNKSWPSDHDIVEGDPDFSATGLKVNSRINLSKLVTIESRIIIGQLGILKTKHLRQISKKLAKLFDY